AFSSVSGSRQAPRPSWSGTGCTTRRGPPNIRCPPCSWAGGTAARRNGRLRCPSRPRSRTSPGCCWAEPGRRRLGAAALGTGGGSRPSGLDQDRDRSVVDQSHAHMGAEGAGLHRHAPRPDRLDALLDQGLGHGSGSGAELGPRPDAAGLSRAGAGWAQRPSGQGAAAGRQASTKIVTGPSLTSPTRIWAPKVPVSTGTPRARIASTTCSTRGSATAAGAAPLQEGRRPLRTSAYRVNCETTSTAAPASSTERSPDRIRSSQIFLAMVATCSGPSSWVTPIRASRPSPSTAPTTSPSTSTWTPSTLCRTARIPRWYVRRDAGGPQDRPRSGAHDGIDA